jgi:RNA polymerase sigma-70 factor (ECF subfamily)
MVPKVSTTRPDDRPPTDCSGTPKRSGAFVTTRWSVVLQAGGTDTTSAGDALSRLCHTYWYPLYAYVRGQGRTREDAEDLTQGFFARLLEKKWLMSADREKGRFRSFMLLTLKRFMADEWDKQRAQKRGGGHALLPLPFETGETRFSQEPRDFVTPEQSFERRWVLAMLENVMERLREEYASHSNAPLFETLSPCLAGDRTAFPYSELATKLALSESAVKSAVHRLRQRYRKLLREEIAETVESHEDVEEELRHLFSVLGRSG